MVKHVGVADTETEVWVWTVEFSIYLAAGEAGDEGFVGGVGARMAD